jgi:hypothetical protein
VVISGGEGTWSGRQFNTIPPPFCDEMDLNFLLEKDSVLTALLAELASYAAISTAPKGVGER